MVQARPRVNNRPANFEAEARAHQRALIAFARPLPRAGGALMRDASLVLDRRTGRNVSADNVNRNFRRAEAQLEALRARYAPNAGLIWNAGGDRLVLNTRENRAHTVALRRADGIARTQARRALEGIPELFREPPINPEPEPEPEPVPVERANALENHVGEFIYRSPRGVNEDSFEVF